MSAKGRINDYIGYRIREIRNAKGMTSYEVARRSGIAPGSYSCLENGWYKINLDNLFRILHALKADITEVWPNPQDSPETIDDEFLADVVEHSEASRRRQITLDDVFNVVCQVFDVPKDKVLSQSRWARLIQPRAACGILVRRVPSLSLTGLCQFLGVSNSSMSHLIRRYDEIYQSKEGDFAARVEQSSRLLEKQFPGLFAVAKAKVG